MRVVRPMIKANHGLLLRFENHQRLGHCQYLSVRFWWWGQMKNWVGKIWTIISACWFCLSQTLVSPDAEFPIINGEKGNITEYLHFGNSNDGSFKLKSFTGGLRENMVPESATAIFAAPIDAAELMWNYKTLASAHKVSASLRANGDALWSDSYWEASHGSTTRTVLTGATYFSSSSTIWLLRRQSYPEVVAQVLLEDFAGEKLGIAYTDAKWVPLSMNAGVSILTVPRLTIPLLWTSVTPRYWSGKQFRPVLKSYWCCVCELVWTRTHPHYVPADDEL